MSEDIICGRKALHVVHWPGRMESYVCNRHLMITLVYGKDNGVGLIVGPMQSKDIVDCSPSRLKFFYASARTKRARE